MRHCAERPSNRVQKKETRRLGRPVTYKGDPESSQLSDGERKRVKRRIANRESARRVRQKRQVLMEELHCKVGHMKIPLPETGWHRYQHSIRYLMSHTCNCRCLSERVVEKHRALVSSFHFCTREPAKDR
jgi:hypothetical protein